MNFHNKSTNDGDKKYQSNKNLRIPNMIGKQSIKNKNKEIIDQQLVSDIYDKVKVRVVDTIKGVRIRKITNELNVKQEQNQSQKQTNESNKMKTTTASIDKEKENFNNQSQKPHNEIKNHDKSIIQTNRKKIDKNQTIRQETNNLKNQIIKNNETSPNKKMKFNEIEKNVIQKSPKKLDVSKIEIEDNLITIEEFNIHSLQSQQLICTQIISNHKNIKSFQIIKKINILISFIRKYEQTKVYDYIHISSESENIFFMDINDEIQNQILSKTTVLS